MSKNAFDGVLGVNGNPALCDLGDELVVKLSTLLGRGIGVVVFALDAETGSISSTTNLTPEAYVNFMEFINDSESELVEKASSDANAPTTGRMQ